jgi:DNA-binding LytR/AlgR family response regulator
MRKLCLTSRDELIIIDLRKVAYMEADGNYTSVFMIDGMKIMLSFGLGKMEDYLKGSMDLDEPSPFTRLGRKLIINENYLFRISITRQKLVLSDQISHSYVIPLAKNLLKAYKEVIASRFNSPQTKK